MPMRPRPQSAARSAASTFHRERQSTYSAKNIQTLSAILCTRYLNTGCSAKTVFLPIAILACSPILLPQAIAPLSSTGKEILGPHVDDPDGPGIGFADFEEQYAFTFMDYHYSLTNFIDPYRRQFLRFIYGNDTPALYGYGPDAPELSNIKDAVEKSIDSPTTIVFRNGWESYMRNRDAYKKASAIPDSTETALKELIEDEKVDRLIVLSNGAHYSNIITFGYCWRDAGAAGVSRVDNATYYDCITDVSDGYGPGK